MVALPRTGASRYHNCCIDGGNSQEYFGYTLVLSTVTDQLFRKVFIEQPVVVQLVKKFHEFYTI
jgi:hypothetical protein